MQLFHGSTLKIKTPDLNFGRYNLDFGRGFYVTTLKEQSEKWAKRRVQATRIFNEQQNIKPIVSVYEADFTELAILNFDGYSEDWLDFVVKNRGNTEPVRNLHYDVILGNVADDDVARAVDDFMELLAKNRVNADVRKALLYQLQFSQPNDQCAFVSQKGIEKLQFVESYVVEGKI